MVAEEVVEATAAEVGAVPAVAEERAAVKAVGEELAEERAAVKAAVPAVAGPEGVPAAVLEAATRGCTNSGFLSTYNQPRQIIPPFPPSASDNQQLLYQLADGTGGFVIVNSNDLLGGMQRIANDTSHYYTLGYTPPPSDRRKLPRAEG